MKPNPSGPPKYPLGTLAVYGPDNQLATKLVATVFTRLGQREPDEMHRWVTHAGDVRRDRVIGEQVIAFFKKHGVRQTVMTERIIGCAHEEGVDYPLGAVCPHCPFWANVDRFTHEPKPAPLSSESRTKVGRNDLCPCGSRKKYKKCCGASK